MLENYLITQGREWERYAWIKARVVVRRPRAANSRDLVRPFVFRRHLDYGAFESMREPARGDPARSRRARDMLDNVKLGPGGIREIEFIVQLFQLVRGGHDAGRCAAARRSPCCRCWPSATCCRRRRRAADRRVRVPAQSRAPAPVSRRPADPALPTSDDDQAADRRSHGSRRLPRSCARDSSSIAAASRSISRTISRRPSTDAHPLRGAVARRGARDAPQNPLRELGFAEPCARAARASPRCATAAAYARCREASQRAYASARAARDRRGSAAAESGRDARAHADAAREHQPARSLSRAAARSIPQAHRARRAPASASPWAAQYLAPHPILLDELLDARTLHGRPTGRNSRAQLRDAA